MDLNYCPECGRGVEKLDGNTAYCSVCRKGYYITTIFKKDYRPYKETQLADNLGKRRSNA
jgi:hypothetical protein